MVYRLISRHGVDKIYIDGANPSFIKSLKLQIGEEGEYDQMIARYKAEGLGDATKDMRIVPINFNRAQSNARTLQNDTGTGSWKNCYQLMLLD